MAVPEPFGIGELWPEFNVLLSKKLTGFVGRWCWGLPAGLPHKLIDLVEGSDGSPVQTGGNFVVIVVVVGSGDGSPHVVLITAISVVTNSVLFC